MPPKAYMYGIPKEYYEKYAIRKYGFHGTSHKYVSRRTAEFLGKDIKDLKTIVCHLGNGASLSAVNGGVCVDTSMGLTPLEGLIMGTRSGDVDPTVVEYLCNKEHLTPSEVLTILNKKSGMLGMTGISSDYRDISDAVEAGNQDAINCLEAYYYRVIKYIGSYIAAMGGVDVITFTAGLGEHGVPLRREICNAFEFMGLVLDDDANEDANAKETIITKPESKITVCVIPTNEEIQICKETVELVEQQKKA
jgi:acetate kinase